MRSGENSIVISGIDKAWKDKKVLDQVNLEVRDGEIFGLLGPSGAGKTTLIRILTGQIKPDGGKARILGKDSSCLDGGMYKQWGLMLDNTGLYERLSCYSNLSVYAQIYGLPRTRIREVLRQVGLENVEKAAAGKLSKGMKQRLVLARAVMHRPRILFMDEPTSGLDPKTAKEIHRLIWEQRENGTTVFMTTHNMEEAAKLCGHVALLCQGKIVEYGEPGELCRKYNEQNMIRLLLRDGKLVELPNRSESAEEIREYFVRGAVESIHSSEPDLETVFMTLTGRKLE